MGPDFPQGRNSTACAILVLRNDRKWKHIFIFFKTNLTEQGLMVLKQRGNWWRICLVHNYATREQCVDSQNLFPFASRDLIITFNSLAPGRCGNNLKRVIFEPVLWNGIWSRLSTSCESVSMWMPLNHIDDMSTLVQLMACCLMAPSHYLRQY